jgi:hypothetical protein
MKSPKVNSDAVFRATNGVFGLSRCLLIGQASGFCSAGGSDVSWKNAIRTGHGLHIPIAIAAVDDAMDSLPMMSIAHLTASAPFC